MNQADYIYIFQKIVEEARKEGRTLLTPDDVDRHGINRGLSHDVFRIGNFLGDEIAFHQQREDGWYAELKPKEK